MKAIGYRLGITLVWVLGGLQPLTAAVPEIINFQGRVSVAGVPFQGTGQFKFALVDAVTPTIYWRNSPDAAPADGVPDAAVSVPVDKGLYAVRLGDTSLPNMTTPIGPEVVSTGLVRLRVWFGDGVHEFQQLQPDQPLDSVPYALVAETLAANAVLTGPVGIGVEAPVAPLDVAGGINAESLSLGGTVVVSEEPGAIRIGTPGAHQTIQLAGTARADRFEGDGSGLTGIEGPLKTTSGVVAWGYNSDGQSTVPGGLAGVARIAVGGLHTVALTQQGKVVAWGLNDQGQTTVPVGLAGVTAIAAGYYHTLALKQDGTVVAWGLDDEGQASIPAGLAGVKAIAAGDLHSAALKQDGTVVSWGWNGYHQNEVPPGLNGVVAIAAGGHHTVALKQDGTVVAWGYNLAGQTNVPEGLTGVMAAAAGGSQTVVLKQDGTVVAWGLNDYGQCDVPAGLGGVVAIAPGINHVLALKQDGTVVGWGGDEYGEATAPAGLTGVTAIAAGPFHTAVLRPTPFIPTELVVSDMVSARVFLTGSDRETKQAITPVDPVSVLEKLSRVPISQWSFTNSPGTRHLGPMAQDFQAAFSLGSDNRHIATVDADGVALVAIQGLMQRLEEYGRELQGAQEANRQLKAVRQGNQELRKALTELSRSLQQFENSSPAPSFP